MFKFNITFCLIVNLIILLNYLKAEGLDTLNFQNISQGLDSTDLLQLEPDNITFTEKFLWGYDGLFRKFGLAGDLNEKTRLNEINLRREMLNYHQLSGIISWGLMISSVVSGQLWLDGKLNSPKLHRNLVKYNMLMYGLTASLSILTPPPIIRNNDEFSTTTLHKTLAYIHFCGMVVTPIWGKQVLKSNDYYKTAKYHQVAGYITLGIYTLGLVTILFFK